MKGEIEFVYNSVTSSHHDEAFIRFVVERMIVATNYLV